MAIGLGNALVTAGDSANATIYTTAALTNAPGAGRFVCGFIHLDSTAATVPTVSTVTGAGITTWQVHATNIGYLTNASPTERLSFVYAQQAGAGATTAIVITASGACIGASYVFFELTGTFDATGTNGTGAIVQAVSAFADGNVASITGTNLATATTGNALIAGVSHQANETTTARTNWTQVAAPVSHATPVAGLIGEWTNTLETSYGASWTTAAKAGALGVEIKAPAAAAADMLDPMGMTGFFGA